MSRIPLSRTPRVSDAARREKCTARWLLKPSRGSGEAGGGMKPQLTGCPLFSATPIYIHSRDGEGVLHLPLHVGANWRGGRREEDGREVETPRVIFKVPWPSVNSSSQAASFRESQRQWPSGRERRQGGEQGRESHQAAATWEMRPHLCSVFWKRKCPPRPHPAAPATVCLTQSSRTLKKLKSTSSSFWGTEGG